MAKDENRAPSKRDVGSRSNSDDGAKRSERIKRSRKSRSEGKRGRSSSRKSRDEEEESNASSSYSDSLSEFESYSASDSGSSEEYSESEDERRRRKRKERKRREEREKEKEWKRRKEKEKKRRRKEREGKEDKKRKKKKKKKDDDKSKKGAVTDSWGKYGIIRDTDMWTKRPEFTAWLAEVKKVNLESLPNWEEKLMFKEFAEDHNTATFPSKKYYNLDAYYRRQMEKEIKKGSKKVQETERTLFDDEEQRRLELRRERERQKEEEVEALKRSMQGGLAQAMKEQALLREEMAYQFKIGNHEAAAAIQRRLDPDVPM